MKDVVPGGTRRVGLRDASDRDRKALLSVKARPSVKARLSVRFVAMTVRPPIGKRKRYRHRQLQVIQAEAADPPADRPPLFWKPIADLEVATHDDAVLKLGWHAQRWSIETFFRTLETGCRIEEVRLTTADRLANSHRAMRRRRMAYPLEDDAAARPSRCRPESRLHRRGARLPRQLRA